MRDFFFSCIITLSSSTALYAMEPGEPRLAEHFNIKDHSDAGINDSRREARRRSTNDILEELQQSLLKDVREQKEIAKEHRKELGNTKEIIITSFIGFIDQLKSHLDTESKDKSYINDLLEQERNHLLNLAKINNVSVSTEDATKTGDIPSTDSFDSEENGLNEGTEIDLLASLLIGDLPENARMWLNNAINEKDAFWKGKSLIKAFDAFKDKIDLDKSQEMAADLVEYFLTSADNTADLTYKSNALCWAAYIAEHFEWKELMQRAYKEAFNFLIKQSNSVSYSKYSNDLLTSLSLNSHPLAEAKVMLKQINDTNLRVSLSLLVAAHLKECADRVHPLCWKARFLYHATTCLMDEQKEREYYKYQTLLTYTELVEELYESYRSKAIPSMFWWFNGTAMSLQSDQKGYDQILQKLKSLYTKYFQGISYEFASADKINDEIKIALCDFCLSYLGEVEGKSLAAFERALEICDTLQDPQLQCHMRATVLQSYSKMLLSSTYKLEEPQTLVRKVDEAFRKLSNINKDDKLSLNMMHAFIRQKCIERAQSFLYLGSDLYHIASSEARMYTGKNSDSIHREGFDNWYTKAFESCEQINDNHKKDLQITKLLSNYTEFLKSHSVSESPQLHSTILEALESISSPILKEEAVKTLISCYFHKNLLKKIVSTSQRSPIAAAILIIEQHLYSKEQAQDYYRKRRIDKFYILALKVCQLIPAEQSRNELIDKILSSFILFFNDGNSILVTEKLSQTICQALDVLTDETIRNRATEHLGQAYKQKNQTIGLTAINKRLGVPDSL
ncbi:hypothetical protein [Candidatus Odyssella thessalonicensis]|uniref:hypothetical protein n=1 Tax=Candidatus Odyssella thessalonicensis TaxID=84647 RepID=UPI000225B78E|nr:hypothetical protein [Candidatus Odyssella thessalonicensis]